MKYNKRYLAEIKNYYSKNKKDIVSRIEEFRQLTLEKKYNDIFAELIFCHLTPQSSAKTCWKAVEGLKKKGLLHRGTLPRITSGIGNVRFKNNKASYILRTQKLFPLSKIRKVIEELSDDQVQLREWVVENIKGMGYKEASHFLRNIGLGKNLAILDRHILKNLKMLGVINKIPQSITAKKYYEIENKMKHFAVDVKIPLSHLDLLFWSKQTGNIFK